MNVDKETLVEARLVRQCTLHLEDGQTLRHGDVIELPADQVRTDDKFSAHTDRGRAIVALISDSYPHRRSIVDKLGLEPGGQSDEDFVAALEAWLEAGDVSA